MLLRSGKQFSRNTAECKHLNFNIMEATTQTDGFETNFLNSMDSPPLSDLITRDGEFVEQACQTDREEIPKQPPIEKMSVVNNTKDVSVEINNFKPHVLPFNPASGITFTEWYTYYLNKCAELNLDAKTIEINFANCLEGDAAQFYIKLNAKNLSFDDIVQQFRENFITSSTINFGDFTNLKFSGKPADLLDYFKEKKLKGQQLGLSLGLILEGLTGGLPVHLRNLVLVREPSTLLEWLNVVQKLVSQSAPHSSYNHWYNTNQQRFPHNNGIRSWNTAPVPYRPWSSRFEQPRVSGPRQNSYFPRPNQGPLPRTHYQNPMNNNRRGLGHNYYDTRRYVGVTAQTNRSRYNGGNNRNSTNDVSNTSENVNVSNATVERNESTF